LKIPLALVPEKQLASYHFDREQVDCDLDRDEVNTERNEARGKKSRQPAGARKEEKKKF